jgi:hypothetical protein
MIPLYVLYSDIIVMTLTDHSRGSSTLLMELSYPEATILMDVPILAMVMKALGEVLPGE